MSRLEVMGVVSEEVELSLIVVYFVAREDKSLPVCDGQMVKGAGKWLFEWEKPAAISISRAKKYQAASFPNVNLDKVK
jgi:hypothetical protein